MLTELNDSHILAFSQKENNLVNQIIERLTRAWSEQTKGIKTLEDLSKFKPTPVTLNKLLFSEWNKTWGWGEKEGLKLVKGKKEGDFTATVLYLAEFKKAEPTQIQNKPAVEAIKARTSQLSKEVSNSVFEQIKSVLIESISPEQKKDPIDRTTLVNRIAEVLGGEQFRARAKTIARTETALAYNSGRLASFIDSGLVEAIAWETIFDERRCPICLSRQGMVVRLDDWKELARLQLVAHPNCRCTITPILKTDFSEVPKERKLENNVVVKAIPWMSAGILAAILLKGKGKVKVKGKIKTSASLTDIGIAALTQEIATASGEIKSSEPVQEANTEEVKEDIPVSLPTKPKSQNELLLEYIKQSLGSGNSSIVLWAKSQGQLSKKQSQSVFDLIRSDAYKTLKELETALKQKGLSQAQIDFLKERAVKLQTQEILTTSVVQTVGDPAQLALPQGIDPKLQAGQAIPKIPKKGGSLIPSASYVPPTPIVSSPLLQEKIEGGRGRYLSRIELEVIGLQDQVNQIRESVKNQIEGEINDHSLINQKNILLDSSNSLKTVLELELKGIDTKDVNSLIDSLESDFSNLLNGSNYFGTRQERVEVLNKKIQLIRSRINQVNRGVNQNLVSARNLDKQLSDLQKEVKAKINIDQQINQLQSQLQNLRNQINEVQQKELARGRTSDTIMLALNSRASQVEDSLRDLIKLKNSPLYNHLGVTQEVRGVFAPLKGQNRNLSSYLDRSEQRIEVLPKYVAQLPPSTRSSYKKLQKSFTLPQYVKPVTIRSEEAKQERGIRANRKIREQEILDLVSGLEGEALAYADNLDSSVDPRISKAFKIYEDRLQGVIDSDEILKNNLTYTAKKNNTYFADQTEKIDKLVDLARANLIDPLSEPYFDSNTGKITTPIRKTIDNYNKQLRNASKEISQALKENADRGKELQKIKVGLQKIAKDFEEGRSGTPESSKKFNILISKTEKALIELRSTIPRSVSEPFYQNLEELIQRVETIKTGRSFFLKSSRLREIQDLIELVDSSIENLSQSANLGLTSTLVQLKEQFNLQQQRLKRLPRDIKELPENLQVEWQQLNITKEQIRAANDQVEKSLKQYQDLYKKADRESLDFEYMLNKYLEDFEVLDENNLTTYRKDINKSIEETRGKVMASVADFEDSLELLEKINNPEILAELQYKTLKSSSNPNGITLLSETRKKVEGLDAAYAAKLELQNKIKNEKALRSLGILQAIAQKNTAFTLAEYRINLVKGKLEELEALAKEIDSNQKASINKIRRSLVELHQADPIVYLELKANQVLKKIKEETAAQQQKINLSRTRLQNAIAELEGDLQRRLIYKVRPEEKIQITDSGDFEKVRVMTESMDDEQILKFVEEGKKKVQKLITSRREELESIGLTLKFNLDKRRLNNKLGRSVGASNVTLTKLAEKIKNKVKLTETEAKVFSLLSEKQQETFKELANLGIVDLYDDIFRLSAVRPLLFKDVVNEDSSILSRIGLKPSQVTQKSLKTRKWEEISETMGRLNNSGYKIILELDEPYFKLSGIPSRTPDSKSDQFLLRKLKKLLGVDDLGIPLVSDSNKIRQMSGLDRIPDLTNDAKFTYWEILQAEALAQESLNEVHARLKLYNFNRSSRQIAEFKKAKVKQA